MAGNTNNPNEIFSENDALDINELASLNEDFSPEFIEQLQNQVSKTAGVFAGNTQDDSTLFEEVNKKPLNKDEEIKEEVVIEETKDNKEVAHKEVNESIDDNFIKKYKAKLNKKDAEEDQTQKAETNREKIAPNSEETATKTTSPSVASQNTTSTQIEGLTGGNIIERPVNQEQIKYNESLDYIDDNVKYSKYVIYIDPENTEFIESLTVKERKNLINKILREQDDIAITKRRLNIIQTAIKHTIIAVITIAIAIPITYGIINASLEASINNYRRSQKYFNTLYKEKGKIKKAPKNYH